MTRIDSACLVYIVFYALCLVCALAYLVARAVFLTRPKKLIYVVWEPLGWAPIDKERLDREWVFLSYQTQNMILNAFRIPAEMLMGDARPHELEQPRCECGHPVEAHSTALYTWEGGLLPVGMVWHKCHHSEVTGDECLCTGYWRKEMSAA